MKHRWMMLKPFRGGEGEGEEGGILEWRKVAQETRTDESTATNKLKWDTTMALTADAGKNGQCCCFSIEKKYKWRSPKKGRKGHKEERWVFGCETEEERVRWVGCLRQLLRGGGGGVEWGEEG